MKTVSQEYKATGSYKSKSETLGELSHQDEIDRNKHLERKCEQIVVNLGLNYTDKYQKN